MFANYLFATNTLPPVSPCLFEYVVGSDGIFVRAKRPGLEALIPISYSNDPIRGLAQVDPYVSIHRRVPENLVKMMLYRAWQEGTREILYYLKADPWRILLPDQVQYGAAVRPVDPFVSGSDTLLEVHSHHHMSAFLSSTDDHEERAGFRLYAVLGRVNTNHPQILARVGIYGHFWTIPADWVFELPSFVQDAFYPEEILNHEPIPAY